MKKSNTLFVLYDGACYFCQHSAKAIKIRKAVGELILINARETHPLINSAVEQGLDLNEGIVVYFKGQFFYGKKAVNLLNALADNSTLAKRVTHRLFRNKLVIFLVYPLLKILRKINLKLQGKTKINPQTNSPIFKSVFADQWENLPTVIKKHYGNRSYTNDITRAKGTMSITYSPMMKILLPFLKFFRLFAPPGIKIPVEIDYLSHPQDSRFIFDRRFYYPNRSKPFEFKSTLWKIKENLIIDVLRFGFGLKFMYEFDGKKVRFIHSGYALSLGKLRIPLPLTFLLGKGYGEETPLSDTKFHFYLESIHPLLGKIIRYEGTFSLCTS